MRIYISGPMRHRRHYNFPAFDEAAERVRAQGNKAGNPADLDREMGFDPSGLPDDWDWSEYPPGTDAGEFVDRDLDALATCDAILMLPGWEKSKGATAEHAVAEWRGLTVLYPEKGAEEGAAARKRIPVASGVLDYFPDAIQAIAHCSWVGNEQHNSGEPLHWSREKSADHSDCMMRHFMERGTIDSDGVRHSTKAAWRSLALLQLEIERDQNDMDC